jgi:hypothetical protein
MDAIQTAFSKKERNSEAMNAFGFRLRNQFSQNKAYRRAKELMWLEDLRSYKGIYDPDVRIEAGNSRVYPKIPRSKVNIVLSRLHQMLFSEKEKNWELDVTPYPQISKEIVTQIAMGLVTQDEQGQPVIPTEVELRLAIDKFAKETCSRMSVQIDDQFTEMDYPEETKKVLRSGLQYGTGIMKGPMVGKKSKRRWVPSEKDIDFEEEFSDDDFPDLQFVRIWDWYPDMTGTEIEKMTGSFERHVMTKHDLRLLLKREDFYSDIITQFLLDHPDGNYTPENWESDLQLIDIEAQGGRGEKGFSTVSSGSNDSRNVGASHQPGKKYEVCEFWGYVDGNDLEACGLSVPDVELEYGANVWLLGNRVIKSALYERALDQYKVFYYEKDETSIFGEGLVRVMRHSALSIAAGARMVLDNGAICCGPIVEMNWSLMTPGQDLSSIYPRQIIFREGKGVDAQYPAVREINIDCHVEELIQVIELFKSFGDEETTLPTWLIGQQVNNETAQATSGRNATVLVSIKDIVKNFDTFTEHIIRDMYAWNMDFNPRTDIKGDFKCKARGVSSLVMKEIRMQSLQQLNSTLTPEQRDYIPEGEMIKELFKAHDIDITLRTEEEVGKMRQEREQSVMNQLQIEMIKSDIQKNKSQSMSLLTKARKVNVEATKDAQTPPELPQGTDPRVTDAEVALKGTEITSKEAEIRRHEEQHALDMQHQDEQHRVKIATDTTKTAQEMAIKGKTADHAMEMKAQMTKASAEAKKTAAKQKPTMAKPAKKAK